VSVASESLSVLERNIMSTASENGLISLASKHSVDETLQRLETLLQEKNISVFAKVDHSGEAAKIGMEMRPTKLLIFGNPKGGTPLMQATPTAGIDLPLKALVWQDAYGKVWLTYNDPAYLQKRHHVPVELIANIAGVSGLLEKAAG
jgi:uncharacterized protein (DUF302 family)